MLAFHVLLHYSCAHARELSDVLITTWNRQSQAACTQMQMVLLALALPPSCLEHELRCPDGLLHPWHSAVSNCIRRTTLWHRALPDRS